MFNPTRLIYLLPLLMLNAPPQLSYAASGTEGAAFLDIPVGAEPAAMGSAYTALAQDIYASVYNPAGLGFLDSTQLAGQHLSYLETLNYEYAGIAVPFKKSRTAMAGSVQYLGSGDIQGLEDDGLTPHNYSSYYAAYNLSMGHALREKVAVGLTGKMIHAQLDDVSASAYAVDLGTLYRLRRDITLAATLRNLGSQLKFEDQGDSLPLAFHVGAAYRPSLRGLVSSELVYSKTGQVNWRLGGQWQPMEMFSLRMGYRTDTLKELSALAGFSTGIGLHLWGHELAYAWLPYGDLGDTHYISLLLKFSPRDQAQRNLIQYQHIKSHRTAQEHQGQSPDPDYQQMMELIQERDSKIATQDRTPTKN